MNNIIYISFGEDLSIGRSPEFGRLLNSMRYSMEMAVWKAKNRAARLNEDPDTWDSKVLEQLDEEYERVGMSPIINKYPGIKEVALEIAYDNDMINRRQTETDCLYSFDPIMRSADKEDLIILDEWCQSLTHDEKRILAALQQKCPKPELCQIFNDFFKVEDYERSIY